MRAAVPVGEPKRSDPSATVVTPVPPPPTPSVPESVGAKVKAPEVLVIARFEVRPLKAVDEVAKVMAPVCAVPPPSCWSERRPVLVTFPAKYERPDEKVVVATPVHPPLMNASV